MYHIFSTSFPSITVQFLFIFFQFICQIGTVTVTQKDAINAQQFGFCSFETSWKEQSWSLPGKLNAWSVHNAEGMDWWSRSSDQCLWRGWAGCKGPPDEVAWSAKFPEVSGWTCVHFVFLLCCKRCNLNDHSFLRRKTLPIFLLVFFAKCLYLSVLSTNSYNVYK